ncbi:NVEALA domain-containing protein [Bacteroides heparinolyticus]|uniref:NVEALA domain-containing protein n=1 Tax=Prevotella heparinolytica TaxID=28113 RepID=UPI0035A19A0A
MTILKLNKSRRKFFRVYSPSHSWQPQVWVNKSLKSNANLSDLALANVEALTQSEIGDGRWIVAVYSPSHWRCDPNGGASCPGIPW